MTGIATLVTTARPLANPLLVRGLDEKTVPPGLGLADLLTLCLSPFKMGMGGASRLGAALKRRVYMHMTHKDLASEQKLKDKRERKRLIFTTKRMN